MQDLRESLGNDQGDVDEAVHAIREAGLRFAVELGARLVHALVPANVVELVDLQEGVNSQSTNSLELRRNGRMKYS